MPDPIKWNDTKTAPIDGAWLLLNIDDGSMDSAENPGSSVYVGRWNPKSFPEIGPHVYEWEVIDRYPDSQFADGEILTHWSGGRVGGWLPLPAH